MWSSCASFWSSGGLLQTAPTSLRYLPAWPAQGTLGMCLLAVACALINMLLNDVSSRRLEKRSGS